jgi:hypothetical protein
MPSNYLLKIADTYYFRNRIPKDLIRHFKAREIKKSLKTSSYKDAKVAAKAHVYQLEPPFLLSEAVERFCQWRQQEKPAKDRTQQRYREYFNVMIELLGNRNVTEYSRRDLDELKENLYERPANLKNKPKVLKPLDRRQVDYRMSHLPRLLAVIFRYREKIGVIYTFPTA